MNTFRALDLASAQQTWQSDEQLSRTQRERIAATPDPVRFLAIEQSLQQLCLERFVVDVDLGRVQATSFEVTAISGQQVSVGLSDDAQNVLHRHLLGKLCAQLCQRGDSEGLTLIEERLPLRVTAVGRFIGRFLPYRRQVITQNMRRAYGARISADSLETLIQAHYSHLATLLREFVTFRFQSRAQQAARVRVEGVQNLTDSFEAGRGTLVLTGHFGNFEVSTVSGIEHFPQAKGRIHFLRRPIKPKWLSQLLTRRFNQAGFGVIGRRGSLEEIVNRLEAGDAIVFPFDQYARRPEGIEVPFFDVPAGTYKSMAILAMATGAPVIAGASWREPDGSHVLKFWPALTPVEHEDVGVEIALNTECYNRTLERLILREPAQWWWVHRRWKNLPAPADTV